MLTFQDFDTGVDEVVAAILYITNGVEIGWLLQAVLELYIKMD